MRRWRPMEPLSVREAIKARAAEINAALKGFDVPDAIALRRQAALEALQFVFPNGGKLYVVKRKRTRSGNLLIDVKRADAKRMIPIGLVIADALSRPYLYKYDGFKVAASEMPSLFTGQLSLALYGSRGKIQVEML